MTTYDVPDDVGAVYLFNPFFGDVMQGAMRQVIASYDRRPRRLRIIYAFPSDERTLLATGRIAVLRRYRRRRPLARWEQMRSTTVYEVRPGPVSPASASAVRRPPSAAAAIAGASKRSCPSTST